MQVYDHFRWVERRHPASGNGPYQMVRVLQQWWESEKMIPGAGEWRDVPTLPEDNTPPVME